MLTNPLVINLSGCARCGERHENISFRVLRNPVERFTHWASCPATGEPILLRIENGPAKAEPKAS